MYKTLNSVVNYFFSVRINGKDATEYSHNGDTFLEGRSKSEFELYFKNNTYTKIKVVFSVDGLSVMDGKAASDKSSGYIVNAWGSITVPGWRINSGKVAKFVFRPQGEKNNGTYVEELKAEGFDIDAGNQGVIGCMVFKEKYQPPKYYPHIFAYPSYPQPMYFSPNYFGTAARGSAGWNSTCDSSGYHTPRGISSDGAGGVGITLSGWGGAGNPIETQCFNSFVQNSVGEIDATASLGTGFGDDTNFATSNVEFEAELSPDWVAVIHYDTIINLRKRGVFIESKKAEAFPGYKDGCYVPSSRRQ